MLGCWPYIGSNPNRFWQMYVLRQFAPARLRLLFCKGLSRKHSTRHTSCIAGAKPMLIEGRVLWGISEH